MPSFFPSNYEQFAEVKRQQEAVHKQQYSVEFAKLLLDTQESVYEFKVWKDIHHGDGTLTKLRASARWLNPMVISVGAVPMVGTDPITLIIMGAATTLFPILVEFRQRITVDMLRKEGLRPRK
jgi:hypothetical protein